MKQVASIAALAAFLTTLGVHPSFATPVTISIDTPIKLRLEAKLRSGKNKRGEPVPFSVAEAVTAADGTVLVAAGAKAMGEITRSRGRGRLGRSGKLAFKFKYVAGVDRTKVPLRASRSLSARSKRGAVIATAVFLTPLTLLFKGEDVILRQGRPFEAYVAEDTKVDPDRKPADLATTDAAPVGAQPLLVQHVRWFAEGEHGLIVFTLVNPNVQLGLRMAGLTILAVDADGDTVGLNAGRPAGDPSNTIYCLAPNEIRTFAKELSLTGVPARCDIRIAEDWVPWPAEDSPRDLEPAVELVDGHVRGQVQNTSDGARDIEIVALVKDGADVVGAGTAFLRAVGPRAYAQLDVPILGETTGLLVVLARCAP